jgi:hypothetical protein
MNAVLQRLRHLWRALASRVYFDKTEVVIALKALQPVSSPATFKIASETDLRDLEHFNSADNIAYFRKLLREGDTGMLGYIGERCVYRVWATHTAGKMAHINLHCRQQLKQGEVFFSQAKTAEEARGKNVHGHAMAVFPTFFPHHNYFFSNIDVQNKASFKGVYKAGYQEIYRLRVRVILGWRWIKKIAPQP